MAWQHAYSLLNQPEIFLRLLPHYTASISNVNSGQVHLDRPFKTTHSREKYPKISPRKSNPGYWTPRKKRWLALIPWLLHPPPPYSSSYAYTHTYILSWIGHDRCLQVFVMNHEFFFSFLFKLLLGRALCLCCCYMSVQCIWRVAQPKRWGGSNSLAKEDNKKMNAHTVNPRCELKTFLHWDKMTTNSWKTCLLLDSKS